MKWFAQYSCPVLQSRRHRAFNTTDNYTLFFLVRGECGVSTPFVLPPRRSSSRPARKQNMGWKYGDRSANKMAAKNSRERRLF